MYVNREAVLGLTGPTEGKARARRELREERQGNCFRGTRLVYFLILVRLHDSAPSPKLLKPQTENT